MKNRYSSDQMERLGKIIYENNRKYHSLINYYIVKLFYESIDTNEILFYIEKTLKEKSDDMEVLYLFERIYSYQNTQSIKRLTSLYKD